MQTDKNRTVQRLFTLRCYLSRIEEWGPYQERYIEANLLNLKIFYDPLSPEEEALKNCPNTDEVFPQHLGREEIPPALRVVRQALDKLAPEYNGMFRKWYDADNRTKLEVGELLECAHKIARLELAEIPDLFGEGPDRQKLVLHRWSDREGEKLCAMSALSKKLGYSTLSSTPKEVDPGLTALINLLNDRASDRARQLLIWRLEYLPNTDRTKIRDMIATVFFPQALEENGYGEEAKLIWNCKGVRALTKAYISLGERLLKSDGAGYLASGCITLAAALKSRDPITQDILAVSAASEVVSFEGDGWFDLLYILDYILDLEDSPYGGGIQSMSDFHEYFGEELTPSEKEEIRKNIEPF